MNCKLASGVIFALVLLGTLVSAKYIIPKSVKGITRFKRDACDKYQEPCSKDEECEGYCDGELLICYSNECTYDNNQNPFRKKRRIFLGKKIKLNS